MRYNNLILAFRHMRRRPVYAIVIVLSLALGLSFANILTGFIVREKYTDTFHTHHQNVYRLLSSNPMATDGKIAYILESTSDYVATRFPEVAAVCRMYAPDNTGMRADADRQLFEDAALLAVDSSFFQLFDFPLYQGAADNALRPGTIILSRDMAGKLFGRADVTGQTLSVMHQGKTYPLSVAAVLEHTHENSHLQFDALVHYDTFDNPTGGTLTYLLLHPNTDPKALADKMSSDATMPSLLGNGTATFSLQTLSDVYFDQANTRPYTSSRSALLLTIGWVVAALVLLVAGFNFINLFMSSLLERSREIGMKKLLGAAASAMRWAVVTEVSLYLLTALCLSFVFTLFALPYFSTSFRAGLDVSYLWDVKVAGFFVVLLLLLGTFISLALSVYTEQVRPLHLLQKKPLFRSGFNRILLMMQFVVAMVLIICSAVIIKQIAYIKSKPLGFSRQIMEIKAPAQELAAQLATLKQEIRREGSLSKVSLGTNPLTGNMIVRHELGEGEVYMPFLLQGDEDLIATLGLELTEGQPLNAQHPAGVLVNEKFVQDFAMDEPLQQAVPGSGHEIIRGVVKDFNSVSLREEIPAYIISYDDSAKSLLVNYADAGLEKTLAVVQQAWQQVFPFQAFHYTLIEDRLLSRHEEDFFFFRIVITFSIASILMSCFGLFALAWGGTQRRTKEIAIRKTVGASVWHVTQLLSWSFVKWVLLSLLIAFPLAYLAMDYWLQRFAFKTSMSWWVFVLPGVWVVLISLLTVGAQTIRAALANPVKSLRYE